MSSARHSAGTAAGPRARATPPTPGSAFGPFVHQWAVRLTTYKRDGSPVGTPVNIVVDGDHAYVRTFEEAGKFKRLRRNADVDVAPSTWNGQPTGPPIRAHARLLDGPEQERAAELIDAKHAIFQRRLVRLAHRVRGFTTRHFELVERPPD